MGTIKELLAIAEAQVGKKESPPNSNEILYNDWYYGRHVSGPEYPWCMTFCQWVFNQAHVAVPVKTASCTKLMDEARKVGRLVHSNYCPGDLLLFNFNGRSDVSSHCGICKSVKGIKIESIEGNTSVGNDTNGGEVMIRTRWTKQVVGAFRGIFDGEEDLDMTKTEFLNSLSDKEAYTLLTKAMNYAETLPQPSWSKKEGHWDSAMKKKLIGSDTPESIVRRDELIAILGRIGLV